MQITQNARSWHLPAIRSRMEETHTPTHIQREVREAEKAGGSSGRDWLMAAGAGKGQRRRTRDEGRGRLGKLVAKALLITCSLCRLFRFNYAKRHP